MYASTYAYNVCYASIPTNTAGIEKPEHYII